MKKILKLDIQRFSEDKKEEISVEEQLAQKIVDYDLLKEEKEKLKKENAELKVQKENQQKANKRLMERINSREEKEEEESAKSKSDKPVKFIDYYEYTGGVLKRRKDK